MPTRREFGMMVAASALLAPSWTRASTKIGNIQIDTLSDGHLVLPGDFILGSMPQDEIAPILKARNVSRDRLEPECNLTLVRDGTHTILFDVGAGGEFQQTAGKLSQALDAIGLDPSEVTHVVFTHAHPDHLWGLLDDFDEPFFPNATYMIGKDEWDYWIHPETINTIGTSRQVFAVGAQRRLQAIEGNISFFKDGAEILPNIAARASYGHTPGHMSFHINSGSENLMVIGDAIGNHHVALARPSFESGSDQDQGLAAKTRTALIDQIVHEQMQVVGYHLPQGGLGYIQKQNDGYHFVRG